MASRVPLAQGLLSLLCALAVCTATPAAAPTSPSGSASGSDDPWSDFANKWSPAIQAKINGLKAEVQKATDDADTARTEAQVARDKEAMEAQHLAEAQQQLVAEEPTERNIEARIASALVGWQVAVAFLLCAVACLVACGHQRGAWTLKFVDPMRKFLEPMQKYLDPAMKYLDPAMKYLDPAMKFILKYLDPVLKRLDPALKALSPRLKSLGLSEPFLFVGGRSDEKLKDPAGDVEAELERAHAGEAAAKKHLWELQAWAEASVSKAQAQEGAAMQALQELQMELHRLRNPAGMPPPGTAMPPGSLGQDLMPRNPAGMPPPGNAMPPGSLGQDLMPRNPAGMPPPGNAMPLGSLGQDLMARARSPLPVRPTTPAGRPIRVRATSPFAAAMPPKGTDTPSTLASSPPASSANSNSWQWNLAAGDPWTNPAQAQANAAAFQQPQLLHVNMPNRFHLVAEPNSGLAAPRAFTVGNGQLM